MERRISDEELARALAAAIDEAGNDVRLAEQTAKMTDDERRQSDENIRRWARAAKASLERKPGPRGAV